MMKLFTKSAFKVALTCPAQLWYYHEPDEYANQQTEDEFLQSLAEGGFQVGELAKIYCKVDEGCDLGEIRGYDASVEKTNELLKRDKVVIAEAAFRFGNLFIRADIVRKDGDHIDLIEVKAKSWRPDMSFIKDSSGEKPPCVEGEIREYVYDVAFQKYVLEGSLVERGIRPNVNAYLMLADKSKVSDVDGINQCFKISKMDGRVKIQCEKRACELGDHEHILSLFNVDEVCGMIYRGEAADTAVMFRGQTFHQFIEEKAKWYCEHTKQHYVELTPTCYRCPFFATDKTPGKKDGYQECWEVQAGFKHEDFSRPLLKELWGGGNTRQRSKLFKRGKYFLDDITGEDIGSVVADRVRRGLDYCQRKIIQIGLRTGRPELLGKLKSGLSAGGSFLDLEGLWTEMASWKYPLHMIDFETTAVALPFYAKMRPYEQIAFQFSHHIIERDGAGYKIRHAGQYINTTKGFFPNFEFVRRLKEELDKDDGTVFRYAAHENTILNAIRKQLRNSEEPDRAELIAFIEALTHPSAGDCDDGRPQGVVGVRDMIDLCDIVKRFYYHPLMKGSNSIKAVLPAVLNTSEFLQKKYSLPIYGKMIKSKNVSEDAPVAWISKRSDGSVESPYTKLPDVSAYMTDGLIIDKNDGDDEGGADLLINNGGAALTAYSMLQFCDQKEVGEALKQALLRYCELDTMAMVFIWEYFNQMVSARN